MLKWVRSGEIEILEVLRPFFWATMKVRNPMDWIAARRLGYSSYSIRATVYFAGEIRLFLACSMLVPNKSACALISISDSFFNAVERMPS